MNPWWMGALCVVSICVLAAAWGEPLQVEVKAEDSVYTYVPPNNGSGPLWSYGCTQIARLGDEVFVSEMETGEGVPPLSNTRWRLLHRTESGWRMVAEADGYHQREPCPLAVLSKSDLFLNVNDSTQSAGTKYGPCEPKLLKFHVNDMDKGLQPLVSGSFPRETILPSWDGQPYYTDHSYRGFAADRSRGQLLMLNIDAKTSIQHACLLSSEGKTLANASVTFPIRACYPQAALGKGAAYVLAIGDIVEPIKEWREYKFEQTKREWDYVFRILYFTWSPEIEKQGFAAPIEIANVDKTAGYISNQDLWISPDGEAYIMYTECEVQGALLRDKFFAGKSLIPSLHLAVVKDGAIASRRTLIAGTEAVQPGCARFHVAENGTVYAVLYVSGPEAGNKLMRIYPPIDNPPLIPIPLKKPISGYCLASVRAGNAPSDLIDIHGPTEGNTMAYAQVIIK